MTLKIAVIIIYLGILLLIGVLASRWIKDLRDYFAAGKKLGFWSTAFSTRATGESAWLLLGLTGMGAAVGVKAIWVVLGEDIGVSIAGIMMCRSFKFVMPAIAGVGPYFDALGELPSAFLVSFVLGVVVSLCCGKSASETNGESVESVN